MANVPDAPTAVSGTVENGRSTVSFTPGADGGSPITSYTVTATDTTVTSNGGQTATGSASPIVVSNLVNGDAYTFSVVANNAVGPSASSAASAVVIPAGSAVSAPPDPFPNALQFPLTKPVNTLQLTDEIATATGQTPTLAVTADDSTEPISSTNPGKVWVIPNTLDSAKIATAISDHVPSPTYNTPADTVAFNAVMQKVIANPAVTLTATEQQDAIKGLLKQFSQIRQVPQVNSAP